LQRQHQAATICTDPLDLLCSFYLGSGTEKICGYIKHPNTVFNSLNVQTLTLMFTGVSLKPFQNQVDVNESHTKLYRFCDPDGFFVWFINQPSLKPSKNFCDTPDKIILFFNLENLTNLFIFSKIFYKIKNFCKKRTLKYVFFFK